MSNNKIVVRGSSSSVFYLIIAICTAMIGHTIHGSFFWAVIDFFFWPFAWAKWLVCQEVTLTIIKETFSFFLT